jgi:hypothetical protein
MVAQVRARGLPAEEHDRERQYDGNAPRLQLLPDPPDPGPGTKGVDENAARHAALDGPPESIDDDLAGLVVGEDVEQEVHVRARIVYVGHEAGYGVLILREELHLVAVDNRLLSDVLHQSSSSGDPRRQFDIVGLHHPAHLLGRDLEHLGQLLEALPPPAGIGRPADEPVQDQGRPGQE